MELQGFGTPRRIKDNLNSNEDQLLKKSPIIFRKTVQMASDSTFNCFTPEPQNLEELKELQGEVRIESFEPLQRNWYKTFLLLPLVAIATALFILIVMRRRKDISAKLMYSRCSMQKATHILIVGNDRTMEIVEHSQPLFFYRKLKYVSRSNHPYPMHYRLQDSAFFSVPEQYLQSGMTPEQVIHSRALYGLCQHTVQIPTLPSYLAEEMLGIFFILQYITCAIYILQNFIFFGVTLISVSFISTIINYFLLRNSYMKIKELAEHYTTVNVVRDGAMVELSSSELVPGDVFEPKGVMPCDSILVQGELYLNEASLTGESVPIGKTPVKTTQDIKNQSKWLYEGSVVVESRGKPLALAVNTGYTTRRGRIFRKILYRQHKQPEFYITAFYFLLEIFAYCTIIFVGMIPIFIWNQISAKLLILRFFDMVGWAIPPSFPIAFNVCYSFSLYRLRKQGIFGTEPYKTIVSGKVTTVCFDKTGTLTENAMQLHSTIKFQGTEQTTIPYTDKLKQDDILNKLMASCHTVRKVNQEFLGDELDLRMFLYSGYNYSVPENNNQVSLCLTFGKQKLEVLRINQFESKFQSMSVLVRDCNTNKYFIFVKGAPEKIQKISLNKVQNFDSLLSNVSLAGLRCLGVAYREVSDVVTWMKCDRLRFENELTLLGLVTFENKLKLDTVQTISYLRDAYIQCKIITGDNIYIAVQTATRTGIIHPNDQILILRGEHQTNPNGDYIGQVLTRNEDSVYTKNITISADYLKNTNTITVAIDNGFLNMCPFIPKQTKIFARITPESKALVVRKLIEMKKVERKQKSKWERLFGRTLEKVAMVGDGANDIMAIKEADMGIGISDTDSSFAANFSISQLLHVDCILRQGKCTLSIIIDTFRYYGGISVIKYLGNMILVWDKSSFNDNQFTYLNYGSTIEIVGLLCLSKPAEVLSCFMPNDNLMGLQNRLIFIGNILIPLAGLMTVMAIVAQDLIFIANPNQAYDDWVFSCVSNTAIFLPSHLFYIWNTFWVYTSRPWKQPIFKNLPLFIWLLITITINTTLFFFTSSLSPFFMMVEFPKNLEAIIFGVTYGFIFLGMFWRLFVDCLQLHKTK